MVNVLLPPTPLELPPRARRILEHMKTHPNEDGTTSACAENTMRNATADGGFYELPPRARRIQAAQRAHAASNGTTSACAENTRRRGRRGPHSWNYLRVRGEYQDVGVPEEKLRELPPRARRILEPPLR